MGGRNIEVIAKYRALGGIGNIEPGEATEPGALAWLPDKYSLLKYAATLYKVAEGLSRKYLFCIELARQYIDINCFCSYSGFIAKAIGTFIKKQPPEL
jgi:hypothetical protein